MSELKTCPFCGMVPYFEAVSTNPNTYGIGCPNFDCGVHFTSENQQELFNKWNTRAPEADAERIKDEDWESMSTANLRRQNKAMSEEIARLQNELSEDMSEQGELIRKIKRLESDAEKIRDDALEEAARFVETAPERAPLPTSGFYSDIYASIIRSLKSTKE